jgi:hypothetical protein
MLHLVSLCFPGKSMQNQVRTSSKQVTKRQIVAATQRLAEAYSAMPYNFRPPTIVGAARPRPQKVLDE